MKGRNDKRREGKKEESGGGGGQLVKEMNLRKIRRWKGRNSKCRKEGRQKGFCVSWFTFWRLLSDVSIFYTSLLLKGFVFPC